MSNTKDESVSRRGMITAKQGFKKPATEVGASHKRVSSSCSENQDKLP